MSAGYADAAYLLFIYAMLAAKDAYLSPKIRYYIMPLRYLMMPLPRAMPPFYLLLIYYAPPPSIAEAAMLALFHAILFTLITPLRRYYDADITV